MPKKLGFKDMISFTTVSKDTCYGFEEQGASPLWKAPPAYLGSCSSLLLVVGVLVQLIGLLLLIYFIEAVDLEELEVLQLRHLGQPRTTRPATQTTAQSRTGSHAC